MRPLVISLALGFALFSGCTCERVESGRPSRPAITTPFVDSFERVELGPDWLATEPGAYRIEEGELVVRNSYNHPLWLLRRIPRDARIELDCWSGDEAGDLKVEIWGDGRSHAVGDRALAYTSTAYNFIFGGWNNTVSTLARMEEHGHDRHTRSSPRVVKGQRYHWTITRRDRHIEWQIDGQPFITLDDPVPLDGENHGFFGFTNWEAELHFDNLKITPL